MRSTTAGIIAALALTACQPAEAPPAADEPAAEIDLTDDMTKVSYAIGVDMANSLKRGEIETNVDALNAGIRDTLGDGEPLMSEEDVATTLREFRTSQREAAAERRRTEGESNEAEGAAFLEENGQREGVTTTESGLQYEVLETGDGGAKPGPTDRVTVNYRGTLIDGEEFDSSYSRGEPASFRVNGVIRGWTEALQLMSVGDKYKLFIPGDLAYGPRGSGAKIGPNAVLVFEVELLEIDG